MGIRRPTVAVLGAGAGGIAIGVKLAEAGYDFTIFERSDGVGGTWRDNTYPGVQCDVPSHLYSFSFALNPNWSRTYAMGPEILAYLEGVADRFGVTPRVAVGVTIEEARWDDDAHTWTLTTSTGEQHRFDVLVSGLGMLNVPHYPDIPGSERFAGRTFHSARWDHSRSTAGERVAVVGSGASAIQFVPAIAPEARHVTVFQRSPVWITPRFDEPFSDEQVRRFASSLLALRRLRFQIWLQYQRASFAADSEFTEQQTGFAYSYLERKVEDPELRARLTPDYPFGCKRPLISRDWYPTLTRSDVDLVTTPIQEITPAGVRTTDGVEHAVDTIVYGTGFKANEFLTSVEIIGRDGRRLRDDWADGAEAHLGITVAGYPNFFMLYGPNTNGVNSILYFHEAQSHFIMSALRSIRRWGRSLEVRPGVQARHNRRVQAAMVGTVWAAGCGNYFRAPSGKVVTQCPYSSLGYWARTRIMNPLQYRRIRRSRRTVTS